MAGSAFRKKISICSSCFNEVDNLRELYERVKAVMKTFPQYAWEMIIADNGSTDGSRERLRELATEDRRLKVILNANNFGDLRSGLNAIYQASGDAVIPMVSDLQDPPEMIQEFLRHWESGYKVVCAVKPGSKENPLMFAMRRLYYWLLSKFSSVQQISNFTGFGLYDRQFIDAVKRYNDPYPYFRGLVSEIGFQRIEIPFVQEKRKYGKTKNNFFTLYDMAMTGFVNHTRLPLRLSVFCGFILAAFSLLTAFGYFIYKLLYWETFSIGMGPLLIGLFLLSGFQLIFIGVIGEYIGAIWTHVKNKPLVIEEERINFDANGSAATESKSGPGNSRDCPETSE